VLGDLIPVDRVTAGISNQPTIKFDTLWVRCHRCGRPLTALLNQDGGHPAVGTVGKIAARMRAEKIVLFTGLWIFSFHGQESPSAELGTDACGTLLSDRTHTPKKKRATSHGTRKLHYSTPYEVESDTLIFGYWPLPGKYSPVRASASAVPGRGWVLMPRQVNVLPGRTVVNRMRRATDCIGQIQSRVPGVIYGHLP